MIGIWMNDKNQVGMTVLINLFIRSVTRKVTPVT